MTLGITNSMYQAGSLGSNALPDIFAVIQSLIQCAQETNQGRLKNVIAEFNNMETALKTGLAVASDTELQAWVNGGGNLLSGAVGIGTQVISGIKSSEPAKAAEDAQRQLDHLRENYNPQHAGQVDLEIAEAPALTETPAQTRTRLMNGEFGDLRQSLETGDKNQIREVLGAMKDAAPEDFKAYIDGYNHREKMLSNDANTNMVQQQNISSRWQQYGQIIDSVVIKTTSGIGSGYIQADMAKLQAVMQLFNQLAQAVAKVIDINNQNLNGNFQSIEALAQGLGRTYQG